MKIVTIIFEKNILSLIPLQRPFQAFSKKKSGLLFDSEKRGERGGVKREELCRIIGAVCVFNLEIFHCYFRYVKLNSEDGWLLPLWNIRQNIFKQCTLIILIHIKQLIFSTYLNIYFIEIYIRYCLMVTT